MKAVVFSGTTEGRQFSKILANLGVEVLVSVATEIGAEEQDENENITIHVGRCTAAEMTKLLHGASICVDATHPYAAEATRTICEACEITGVEYHRLLRTESELPKNSIVFETAAEAAKYLESTAGNILLTTGAKELPAYKYRCRADFPACIAHARRHSRVRSPRHSAPQHHRHARPVFT